MTAILQRAFSNVYPSLKLLNFNSYFFELCPCGYVIMRLYRWFEPIIKTAKRPKLWQMVSLQTPYACVTFNVPIFDTMIITGVGVINFFVFMIHA